MLLPSHLSLKRVHVYSSFAYIYMYVYIHIPANVASFLAGSCSIDNDFIIGPETLNQNYVVVKSLQLEEIVHKMTVYLHVQVTALGVLYCFALLFV